MKAGKQIKALRLAAGLTQKQLAELAGLAEITIRQYELNKREPKLEQLKKIASVLNVSVSELIDEFIPIIETFGKDVKIETGNRENIPQPLPKTTLSKVLKNVSLPITEQAFVEHYLSLNPHGKQEALKRIIELTRLEEYTKPDTTDPDHK